MDAERPSSCKARWGILATGAIASTFADAMTYSELGEVVAVASRTRDRADRFAAVHQVPRSYEGYDALLDDPDVEVVYVATPHPSHAPWAIAALDAGKHVLCEKPLTLHHSDAERVIAAARRNGRFLMEGFMYRFHPQTEGLLELIRQGTVGEVQAIEVSFVEMGSEPRLFDPQLGGGAILDVGGYCASLSRLVAATTTRSGLDIEPAEVYGVAAFDARSGVDLLTFGILRFESGLVAQLACGARAQPSSRIRVLGEEAELLIDMPPWVSHHHPPATTSEIHILRDGQLADVVAVESPKPLFAYEADHVASHLADIESPVVPWADTLANMRTLDRWRAAIDLRYPIEVGTA